MLLVALFIWYNCLVFLLRLALSLAHVERKIQKECRTSSIVMKENVLQYIFCLASFCASIFSRFMTFSASKVADKVSYLCRHLLRKVEKLHSALLDWTLTIISRPTLVQLPWVLFVLLFTMVWCLFKGGHYSRGHSFT